jgi:hypothetical protein
VQTNRPNLVTWPTLVACLATLLMAVALAVAVVVPAQASNRPSSHSRSSHPAAPVHGRTSHRRAAKHQAVNGKRRAHKRHRVARSHRRTRHHHHIRCPSGSTLTHHRDKYFCRADPRSARSAQAAPIAAPAPAPIERPALVEAISAGAPGVVGSAPAGPGAPAGGWHVAFADGFAAPIGTGAGQDAFWKANTNKQGCCNNSDEIASESPSQVRVGPSGLELLCTASAGYVCGGVDTTGGFNWKPGGGQTFAFEVVAKLPPRDWGEDPGWWSCDTKWTDEIDFFEAWEWGHEEYFAGMPVWKAKTPNAVEVSHEAYKLKSELGNPEESFHRYTTVIKSNNEIEEFIDGQYRWSVPAPSSMNTPWMHLILTHALRVSTHLTGTSAFDIRSVAVYEDAAHGGQNVEGGGLAPGTVLR